MKRMVSHLFEFDWQTLVLKYQKYEERIMCLAETDITPPMLAIGWKKCVSELQDEVFAVIDEIGQENF